MPGKQVELLHSAGKWKCISDCDRARSTEPSSVREPLTDFVFSPIVFHRRKWAARGYEGPSFCPVIDILGLSLVQSRWITQWEHNRTLDVFGHLSDDLLRKRAWFG